MPQFFKTESRHHNEIHSLDCLKITYTGLRTESNSLITSIVKPTRCTISQIYFIWNNTLHVSDGLSVHHQESKTVHTASYHTGSVAAC